MVSAGNTGATMASALLRMGRLPGVRASLHRHADPQSRAQPRSVLVDAGANAECTPEMLVQFAQMAAAFVDRALRRRAPEVGLLSIGEESTKGTPLVKETHATAGGRERHSTSSATSRVATSIPSPVDVVVTDGFTGNVALKTLEGALKFIFATVLEAIDTNDETRAAGDVLFEYLMPLASAADAGEPGRRDAAGPRRHLRDQHGSSNATAIMNALRVAAEMDAAGSSRNCVSPSDLIRS